MDTSQEQIFKAISKLTEMGLVVNRYFLDKGVGITFDWSISGMGFEDEKVFLENIKPKEENR